MSLSGISRTFRGQGVASGLVLLAYVDESGNTGAIGSGGSLTYSLGCVLVDAEQWPTAFDRLLMMRRRLRDTYGLPTRAEVKANYLIRDGGSLRSLHLAPPERSLIYRAHLDELANLPARAFAVVVDKRTYARLPGVYFDLAWEGLLQRLEHTSRDEARTFMVVHDEGENDAVRRWTRRARRHLTAGSAYGTGSLRSPARLLVDDPVPRQSQHSYFIQTADLVAYAAFRSYIPPGPNVAQVCQDFMWLTLGSATHVAVNSIRRLAAPGIVVRH